MQASAFAVARKLGLETVCVDPASNATCRELAHHFYVADLADMGALESIASRHGVDGVMTLAADYPLDASSALCAKLGLSGPSPSAVAVARDKARLRQQTCGALPITPRWHAFDSLEAALACVLFGKVDCVVKPADSSGGRGVYQLDRDADQNTRLAALQTAFAASKRGRVMVEEFIPGPEYSIESLTFEGKTRTIAVTEKTTSGPPYFVEIKHVVPATLSADEYSTIVDFAKRVIDLAELDWCATHIEIKLSPSGPVLVEMAARLGGGFINTDLVPLALGVDMVKAVIDVSLGLAPDLNATKSRAAAIRFLIPAPGTFIGAHGMQRVRSLPGVERVVCDYSPQEQVGVVRDATGRKSYLICQAENTEMVRALADEAAEMIEFELIDHD